MKISAFGSRRGLLVLLIGLLLGGCATGIDRDPADPLEPYNRSMHAFNELVDRAMVKPLAGGYAYITPEPVDRGVTNFFNNLRDVRSSVNNLLQLKVRRAVTDLGRFAVNSTVGILGVMDVASNFDMPRYNEDFGQTLGVWGMDAGPFVVLPFLGPSSARDSVGLVVDWYSNPLTYVNDDEVRLGLRALDVIDRRSDLMDASRAVNQAALDPYAFIRDAYLQRRQYLVYDGDPPEDY